MGRTRQREAPGCGPSGEGERPRRGCARSSAGKGRPSIFAFMLRHRVWVLGMALLLLLPSIHGLTRLKVEYDLTRYLPDDLESVKGLELLNKHFGFASSATVAVRNRSDWEVQRLKDSLEQIEGVSSVFWLSDLSDFSIPRPFQRQLVEQFYRKDATLLIVRFAQGGSSAATQRAIEQIRSRLKEGMSLAGSMVATLELQRQSQAEKPRMLLMSLLALLIVLAATLPSFAAPFLFLLTLGLSVVWNIGLAYVLHGRISFVTDAFGAALQLGVTMDYCVFLMHRFEEGRKEGMLSEDAMVAAMHKTVGPVLAGSLTTVAGFAALGLMKVQIGADLGFTMARGVLIAAVAAVTVLPCLTMFALPLLDRWRHRSLLPSFCGVGRAVSRLHLPLFLALLLAAVPAWYGHSRLEVSHDLEHTMAELPSMKALQQLQREYGVVDSADVLTRGLPAWKNIALEQRLGSIRGVAGVTSYHGVVGTGVPGSFIPEAISRRYLANGYYHMEVALKGSSGSVEGGRTLDEMSRRVHAAGGESYLTGQSVINHDLRRLSKSDLGRIERLTPLFIGLIIALSFGSITVPLLLVPVILSAVWANQSIASFGGTGLFFFATVALSCIQLGATVDYAIIMTSRYREERASYDPSQAASRAVAGSAGAICASGLTLFAATIGIHFLSSSRLISDLALLLARGALISVFLSIFLLPGALVTLDRIFQRTSLKWPTPNTAGPALGKDGSPSIPVDSA